MLVRLCSLEGSGGRAESTNDVFQSCTRGGAELLVFSDGIVTGTGAEASSRATRDSDSTVAEVSVSGAAFVFVDADEVAGRSKAIDFFKEALFVCEQNLDRL